jgi:hypothetical protein
VNLICFHFSGEEKFSWLPSKNKVADKNRHFQRQIFFGQIKMFSFRPSLHQLVCTLFLEGSQQHFSPLKKSSNESRSV